MQRILLQSSSGPDGAWSSPLAISPVPPAWALRWHESRAPTCTLVAWHIQGAHVSSLVLRPCGAALRTCEQCLCKAAITKHHGRAARAAIAAQGGKGDLVLYFKGHFSSTKSSQMRAAAGRRRDEQCNAAVKQRQCLRAQQLALSGTVGG